jgi:predicted nuclease of predicted toxin-antitoxin system
VRILVDEDLASRELVRRLKEGLAESDVLEPEYGASDLQVWQRAQAEKAAMLTGNVVDFVRLAGQHLDHYGLLLVYRLNDREKDLRAADIAAGVLAIRASHGDEIRSLVLAVNDFARDQSVDSIR